MTATTYWNHNAAYHPWIVGIAASHRGDVLDVGCGEGLLLERLAPVCRSIVGVEPDTATAERARRRVVAGGQRAAHVRVVEADFLAWADEALAAGTRFDVVVFVASLHHLDLMAALERAVALLRPGGELLVVGLAANRTRWDWVTTVAQLPVVRWMGWRRGESPDIGVPIAEPREDLRHIRQAVRAALPGAQLRRGLYYRYVVRGRARR